MAIRKWREAYRKVEEFCKRLGGKLISGIDAGLASEGEKLFFVSCLIPRRLGNDELAEALVSVPRDSLSVILHELGDFEIEEDVPNGRKVKLEPISDTVSVYANRVASFGISPDTIEYVYPDAVEDYLETRDAYITVRAAGSRTAFEKGELKAWADGHLLIRQPASKTAIKKLLDELDKMMKDILKNPRNFFKFI